MLGGILGKAAPAATDLQNVRSWPRLDALADLVILMHLALFERLVRVREIGRGISHARIKPFLVEGISEVIVRHDVLARAGLRVPAAECMAQHVH